MTGLSGSSGKTLPKICGVNTGLHMYIDAGTQTSSNAVLNAVLTGSSSRKWKILSTQIPCSSRMLPPTGCLQYHTGTTGQVGQIDQLRLTCLYLLVKVLQLWRQQQQLPASQ